MARQPRLRAGRRVTFTGNSGKTPRSKKQYHKGKTQVFFVGLGALRGQRFSKADPSI
jgi:hypothetical protein